MKLKNVKVGEKYKIKFVNDLYHMYYLDKGDVVVADTVTDMLPDNIRVFRTEDDCVGWVGAECLKRIKPKLKIGDTCVLLEGFNEQGCASCLSTGDEVEVALKWGHNPNWEVRRITDGYSGWTSKKYLKKVKGD